MKSRLGRVLIALSVMVLASPAACGGQAPAPSPAPKPPPAPSVPVKPPPAPPPPPKASPAPATTPKPAVSPPAAPKPVLSPSPAPSPGAVKVKWFGQASFLITSSRGTKIITDPYTPGARLSYGEIAESADIVTVSHEHGDHNNVAAVGGSPQVVRATAEAKGIKFQAVPTFHDASQGKERGNNTVFAFEVDGLRFCHLGDLGHLLSDNQVAQIGRVDVLLMPVGGNFTIDATAATTVAGQLKPAVIIPMHFQTDKTTLPIVGVDDFLKGKENVTRMDASEVELRPPLTGSRIIVLKPAR